MNIGKKRRYVIGVPKTQPRKIPQEAPQVPVREESIPVGIPQREEVKVR